MLLLLVLVVVVVAMAGAGLLGVGLFSSESRQRRSGLAAMLSAPVAIVIALLVLAVLVMGGVPGRQAPEEERELEPVPTSTPAPSRGGAQGATTIPGSRVTVVPAQYRTVGVRAIAGDATSFPSILTVGGLVSGDVVQVLAAGFGSFERGVADQCVIELGRQTACTPSSIPVQFDEDGSADFLFVIRGDVAPGGCRVGQPTCLLRVRGAESGRQGRTQTVIGDPVALGQTRVMPERGLSLGQTVDVAVTGYPAGTTATAVLCAPTDVYDARRCSSPTDGSTFAVDGSGSGRGSLVIARSPVGTDRVQCGSRRQCAVVVVVGNGFVAPGSTVPVGFTRGPGVSYSSERVLTGLAIAAVLTVIALLLGLRTDWTKPTEAATPELDKADLRSDLDLDALFGTEAELDERDPIPW